MEVEGDRMESERGEGWQERGSELWDGKRGAVAGRVMDDMTNSGYLMPSQSVSGKGFFLGQTQGIKS